MAFLSYQDVKSRKDPRKRWGRVYYIFQYYNRFNFFSFQDFTSRKDPRKGREGFITSFNITVNLTFSFQDFTSWKDGEGREGEVHELVRRGPRCPRPGSRPHPDGRRINERSVLQVPYKRVKFFFFFFLLFLCWTRHLRVQEGYVGWNNQHNPSSFPAPGFDPTTSWSWAVCLNHYIMAPGLSW